MSTTKAVTARVAHYCAEFLLQAAQWRDAAAILSTATERTDEVLWAIGAFWAAHPWDLVRAWDGGPLIQATERGTTLGHGRTLAAHSGRISIETRYGPAVLTVDQSAVRRLVIGTVPAGLAAEVRALHDERLDIGRADVQRQLRELHGQDRPSDDEREAAFERRADVERRCRDAGRRVWEHVRPGGGPVQLGLFELLGQH